MNTVDQLVEEIKQATDYQINKKILKEKILADLHMPYNSGLFKLSPDILAFVSSWPNEELFLEDVYENPIKITKSEFLDLATKHYYQVMNQWHIEHDKIKRIRKV